MIEASRLGRPPRRSEETTQRLRRDIAAGRFSGSDALPGERQLAELLQVSRTTLRRALAELIAEGVLVQRQGFGTVVNRPAEAPGGAEGVGRPFGPALDNYKTIGLLIDVTSARDLWRGFADAEPDEAMALAAAPGHSVYRTVRLLLMGERGVAVETAAAPRRFLPDPPPDTAGLLDSLLLDGSGPAEAIFRLRSARFTPSEAAALDLDPATPAVALQKALYLEDGRCCALIRTICPASALDLVTAGDVDRAPT